MALSWPHSLGSGRIGAEISRRCDGGSRSDQPDDTGGRRRHQRHDGGGIKQAGLDGHVIRARKPEEIAVEVVTVKK
jgi:hypothetical protein